MHHEKTGFLIKTAYRLALCFLIGILFSALFLVNIKVSGDSMLPGLHEGDRCLGPKHFWDEGITYGSIVVIDDRNNGRILVKRAIGFPGDSINILEDGSVVRNREALDEPYMINQDNGTYGDYLVPEGCIFVLGDNRGRSSDSRSGAVGYVPENKIIGRAVFRFWPLNRIGFLK